MYCLSNLNYNENKTINQENFMNLWPSPLIQLLFLATRLTKELSFDWFKSHSPLFESQWPDHQVKPEIKYTFYVLLDNFWCILTTLSHDSFLRIRFLLVPKIGSREHIENDLPTHESVILKKNGWK